jgi:phage repressor protein C with HTH and peptisase S24 domain
MPRALAKSTVKTMAPEMPPPVVPMTLRPSALLDQPQPKRFSWIVCTTDQMAPTLQVGDDVIVDTTVTEITEDGAIYVIDSAFYIEFARLRRYGNGVIISFDNKEKYKARVCRKHDGELKIAGRVRMIGRKI